MVVKLSDHLNISLGLQALVDSAAVTAIIRDTNIAMDSGTMVTSLAPLALKGLMLALLYLTQELTMLMSY